MKTRSCNFDHLIPKFYVVTVVCFFLLLFFSDKEIHPFPLFCCSKIDYGCTHNLFLSQEKQQQNDLNFQVKIFIYTVVKSQD